MFIYDGQTWVAVSNVDQDKTVITYKRTMCYLHVHFIYIYINKEALLIHEENSKEINI